MNTVVETKRKIVIGIPGNSFTSKFLISWTSTFNALWESGKYDIVISPGVSSFVTFARMQTLGLDVLKGIDQKPFNGIDFDVWITIDSDIVYTPQQFMELVDSTLEHDVVSGVYRMVDLQHFAVVEKWDTEYFGKNGTFKFWNNETYEEKKKEQKYHKVSYTGMGFMAITRKVLDCMVYPYFNSDLQEIKNSDGKIMRDITSEDVAFCKNIQAKGFDIMVNTNIRVGHEKQIVI